VAFVFGPFQLDEPRRVLRLDGRELMLQPRIFDLLVYLVHKRTQVVSKDELLGALWPNVTVTEGSLQRAVSLLRTTLREGGMEHAIRSFPRIGYRFCLDDDASARAEASDDEMDEFDAARHAAAEQSWKQAATHYAALDAIAELGGTDLDFWALSLQCLGRPSEAIPLLIRAVTAHTQAGQSEAAAVDAVMLSIIHLERGEIAVAKGWLARAETLVGSDSSALGRIHWAQSRIAAFEGDLQQALTLADRAFDHGKRLGFVEIEALGLMYRGFFKLSLGDTRGGLADQDHAAVLGLSGNCDPMTGGVLYCNILWACRTFGDWARANQWTIGYQHFCSRSRMQFSGSCQLHRAEVLGIQGSLPAALAHVQDALGRLKDDAPWAQGDAYRVLGDIHSAAGDSEAALAAYQKAYALGWDPEPGHAMLLLERGEADAAYISLERSLVGRSWWTLQRQGILLAHLALAAVHAGRFERAETLVKDLAGAPERWPMPSIRALTNEASALLTLWQGDPETALHLLHLARQLWSSIDSPIHAARLRLRIAELQLDMKDMNGAATEVRAALIAAEALDSKKLRQACRALEEKLAAVSPASR
jgi:DNA-binding winged helix-turn-helix (wHTH) protein